MIISWVIRRRDPAGKAAADTSDATSDATAL